MNDKIKVAVILALAIVVASSVMVFSHDEVEAVEAGSAESFDSAIANYTGSGTVYIDLTDDITFSDTYTISKKVNLDLNGFDIVFLSGGFNVSGTLTVGDSTASDSPVVGEDYSVSYTSGTISSPGTTIIAHSGGKVTINDGHIEGGNIALYAQGNKVPGGQPVSSTITVKDGFITAQEFSMSPQGNGAAVIVKGGVLESRDNAVIGGNDTLSDTEDCGGTSINIEDGTLIGHIVSSGYVACGIYAPNYGSVVMTGGTIYVDGGVGILARAGTVEVWDGDIIVTGDETVLGMVGDSRVVVTASAIVVDVEAGYPGATGHGTFSTTVFGGNLISESQMVVNQIGGDQSSDPKVIINGGHFSSDPGSDFYKGKVFDTNTGEVSTPVEDAVVTVNGVGYPSLYEAFLNSTTDNMEIKLLKDDTLDNAITFVSGKNVEMDLKGNDLTLTQMITANSGSSLIITDSVGGGSITRDNGNTLKSNGIFEMSNVTLTSSSVALTVTGTAVITNSIIESTGSNAISITGGTVTVTDCTVKSAGAYAINVKNAEATITGGSVTSESNADVYGGSGATITIGVSGSDESDVELDWVVTYVAVYKIHIGEISKVTGSRFADGSEFECVFHTDVSKFAPGDMVCENVDATTWRFIDLPQEQAAASVGGKYYRTLPLAVQAMKDGDTLTLLQNYEGEDTITLNIFNGTVNLQGFTITITGDDIGVEVHPNNHLTPPAGVGIVTITGTIGSSINAEIPVKIISGHESGQVSVAFEGVTLNPTDPNGGQIEMGQGACLVYNEDDADWYQQLIKVGSFLATDANGTTFIFGGVGDAIATDVNHIAILMNDVYETINVTYPGTCTVDLNGKTVDVDGDGVSVEASDVTFKNGTIKGIDAATIGISHDNGSVTFENVTIESSGDYGIVSNGIHVGIDVTLRNSTVNAAEWGIYFPSDGTLTIENSVITGGVTGVEIRAGTLNISGDQTRITGNGEFDHTPNGSGTTIGGVAIAVSQHTTNHNLSVNISGGTFTGKYALYEEDLQDSDVSNITLSITGGTFTGTTASLSSENVVDFVTAGTFMGTVDEKYIAPGSSLTQNEDGTYTASVAQTSSSLTVSDETPSQNDEVAATFTIEGAPTDGAAFKWTFNGNIADETGSTYTFKAERSGTLTVEVTIDVYGIEKTFTGSVDITVTVPTTPEDPDEGETTVTIDKDGNTVTETTRPDGSSTVTTEKPPVKEDGNTVTETIVKDTDSDGSTTTITETKYESDSATTTVTEVEDASGNTTVQSQTSVTVDETQDVAVVDKEAITAAIEHMVSIVNDTTAETVVTVETSKEQVTLPANISDVTDAGATLEVVSNIGTVKVDSDVVETLVSDGKDVTITQKDADTAEMNASQQQAVGDNRVIELTASNDDRDFHQLGGTVEVVVRNYVLPDGVDADSVVVFYVDDNGRLSQKETFYDAVTGLLRFWTDHFSYYVIGNTSMIAQDQPDDRPVNPGWNPGQDDDVWIPPTVVVEESGSQSGTTEIVACAAAAVVAALMAAFLIIERRKS